MSPWLVTMVASDMDASSGSGSGGLDPQDVPVDVGAVNGLRDPQRLRRRDLEQREALEHADVAHGLAVEAGARGDRVDQVLLGHAGGAAAAGDQRAEVA